MSVGDGYQHESMMLAWFLSLLPWHQSLQIAKWGSKTEDREKGSLGGKIGQMRGLLPHDT